MKLPSGKEVKLKTPTKEEMEKFSLSGVIVSDDMTFCSQSPFGKLYFKLSGSDGEIKFLRI